MCQDEDGTTQKTGKQWKFDPLGDIKDMIINLDGIVDDVCVCVCVCVCARARARERETQAMVHSHALTLGHGLRSS
jgi:hypothetical protein